MDRRTRRYWQSCGRLFQSLHTSSNGGVDGNLQELIKPLISVEENQRLCTLPSYEEIKRVVFQLGAHKAPGPDGFLALFF